MCHGTQPRTPGLQVSRIPGLQDSVSLLFVFPPLSALTAMNHVGGAPPGRGRNVKIIFRWLVHTHTSGPSDWLLVLWIRPAQKNTSEKTQSDSITTVLPQYYLGLSRTSCIESKVFFLHKSTRSHRSITTTEV